MSNKSLFRKFVKGSPQKPEKVEPRLAKAINEEYTRVAQELGAATVQAESCKRQIAFLINKVDQLGAEMKEREAIEKTKSEQPKETPAPEVTPDVPAQTN
jgi:hypothetical protein